MKRFAFIRVLVMVTVAALWTVITFAQSRPPHPIQVLVSPDKPDWTYAPGEEASFTLRILEHQVPVSGITVSYSVGLEKMAPHSQGEITLKNGEAQVKGVLTEPGFLRCEVSVNVEGRTYRGLATAAYAPEQIQPTQRMPDDFWAFWDNAKAEAAKVPMDVRMTLLADRCTETVNVYEVSIQNYEAGSRIYGILARPKEPGQYPAVLQVPGAGIRPYAGVIDVAEQGIITLQIGIHGIPVTHETALYDNLRAAGLKNYQLFNLDDRDKYYFKRVYLGCVRAVDYLFSLPEFDGSNLAVWGSSQGGALAIVTASLDNRVKHLVSVYPALCDLTGYLHGRAGGWPHMFNERNAPFMAKDDKVQTSAYYDVVNFARSINVPGYYTWGYNDETCPPTSYYSAYNVIQAPKELDLVQEIGHWTYPEQQARLRQWLVSRLLDK